MNAKNTSDAAASSPKTPYCAGSAPVTHDTSDCVQTLPSAPFDGWAGGMNGVKFASLTKKAPTTMTNTTIATLMTVMTAETRLDSRVPKASSAVNTPTMSTGPHVKPIGPIAMVLAG